MMLKRKKKSSLGLIGKIIFAANILAVLLLLLSYLAPVIDPADFWPIAFAGLAYPALLVINICFVIYWLIGRPVFSLISLVAVIIGWKFVISQIGFRESTAIESHKSSANFIRVMTFNVHYFKKVTDVPNSKNDKSVKDQML